METSENKEVIYKFGKFVIDPREKTLFTDGEPTHLTPKEFETLWLLVTRNGHALSKNELMSALWHDSYVEEGNLTKQISRLRKILGDDARIETIPKHGYRFNADVETIAERSPGNPARLVSQTPNTKRRVPFVAAVAFIATSALAAAYFLIVRRTETSTDLPRSIAVLPFKHVGGDGVDDYLQLGLTDALITKLGALKQVIIRPTNAVRSYGDREPLAAGRDLAVDAVLDGNVQRIDQQVRVTLQLIRVRDGKILWSGKFDERFTDILRVQDSISQQIAQSIEPDLTGEERSLLAKRYTQSQDAHQAYVRGRILWNNRTAADIGKSIEQFNEAISKDPNYALAYAGLADAYSLLADYRGAPGPQSYENARAAAQKAISLDENLAEAHTSLAYVSMYRDWDWQKAESGYRRAIALNQNYATAHQWYAEFLTAMGRFDEALAEIRRAQEIDPLSAVINAGEVWTLYFARRYDDAIAKGRELAQRRPDFAEVHEYLKRCYDQKGMFAEAIAARQMRRKLVGLDPAETEAAKRAISASDARTYWQSRLELETTEARSEGPSAFDFAEIYAKLGDFDRSFEWLEKALEERTYTMMYLRVAPNLDPIKDDSRFQTFLKRVRL